MLVLRSILLLLVAIAATLLIPAMPCVPLYSTVINLKKPWISRTFGSIVRIYNAWVRSGAYNNALDVYYLVASGGRNSDYGTRNYAVRPALYSAVINLKRRGYAALLGLLLEYDALVAFRQLRQCKRRL